jgi:predicted nucleic acid-binding protein
MCVIVDANLASRVFQEPAEADFAPVLNWILERHGELVFGGHLATELARMEKPRRFLLALLRAGRARRVSDSGLAAEEAVVEETGQCRSNDKHVLALARVSGARTLCTHDRDLQRDFRNPQLISGPRGSIYQRAEHAPLLRHTTSCGRRGRPRRR